MITTSPLIRIGKRIKDKGVIISIKAFYFIRAYLITNIPTKSVDHLEMIVEDGLWSLPKYRELLFIR